jgi:hypothetical protein
LNTQIKPSARIELDPALREHVPILANLLELYAHDFSEFHSLDIGADGRFGYKSLSLLSISCQGRWQTGGVGFGEERIGDYWQSDSLGYGRILCSSRMPKTWNWNVCSAGSVSAFSGALGSSCDAIECLGELILGTGNLRLYWCGNPTCLCREGWPELATFLI